VTEVPDYSIVVPVYDEQEALPELYERLRWLLEHLDGDAEVIPPRRSAGGAIQRAGVELRGWVGTTRTGSGPVSPVVRRADSWRVSRLIPSQKTRSNTSSASVNL
jgi:hypothetical protein